MSNRIAPNDLRAFWMPFTANRQFKALVARCGPTPVDSLLDDASHQFAQCMRTEGAEGIAAFREKRDTRWVTRFDASIVCAAQSTDA